MRIDRRVVITGMGSVSALGHSVEAFWTALKEGRCGIGPLDISTPFELKVAIGGAIPSPDPRTLLDARRLAMLDRFSVLALVAANEAIAQAGISFEGKTGARTACNRGRRGRRLGGDRGELPEGLPGRRQAHQRLHRPARHARCSREPDQHDAWTARTGLRGLLRVLLVQPCAGERSLTDPERCCGRGACRRDRGPPRLRHPEGLGRAPHPRTRHLPPLRPQPQGSGAGGGGRNRGAGEF